MDGAHAQLAIELARECPLRHVAVEYDLRRFVPARGEASPQVVVGTEDPAILADDPAVEAIAAAERSVVCRLRVSETGSPPDPCESDRCPTGGFDYLPVRPYARSWDDEWLRLQFAVEEIETLRTCVRRLREGGLSVSLETLGSETAETGSRTVLVDLGVLTPRQREIAELAVEREYYDADGATAAELADRLGISKATLSEHLRTVRAKLGRQLFVSE
jgi:DNA-binding CsgD family transcriptional regulator